MWSYPSCIFVVVLAIAENAEANTTATDPMGSKVIENERMKRNSATWLSAWHGGNSVETSLSNEKNLRDKRQNYRWMMHGEKKMSKITSDGVDDDYLEDEILMFKSCINGITLDNCRRKKASNRRKPPRSRKPKKNESRTLDECIEMLLKESSAHRIVGGTDAPDGKYPYIVSLRMRGRHFCGGSILDDRWILTAAHCLQNGTKNVIVVVGTNRIDESGDKYRVESHVIHQKYREDKNNDIALILVDRNIVFGVKVQPIQLQLPTDDPTADNVAFVAGWGRLSFNGDRTNMLQHIRVTVINNKECKELHSTINEDTICTLDTSGVSPCSGDSGGPLVSRGVQIGIAVRTVRCANGYPNIYTRVSRFIDWIMENKEKKR